MRKVLCFLLLIIVPPIPGQAPDQPANESKKPKSNGDTKQQPAKPIPPVRVDAGAAADPNGQGAEEKKRDDPVSISTAKPLDIRAEVPKDWMDRLNWLLTAVLVVVGCLGVRYAKRTLNAIEGQLKEIKAASKQTDKMIEHVGIQAQAARESAAAMMNNQRAWVLVRPVHNAPELRAYSPSSSIIPENTFSYKVWNAGKTTATDVKAFAKYEIRNTLDDLSTVPPYGAFEDFPDGILIPTDGPETGHVLWTLKKLEPISVLSDADIEDIKARKKFLYAYGIVTYSNGVGGNGVTCFGLVYHFPIEGDWKKAGFIAAGPRAYNRTT